MFLDKMQGLALVKQHTEIGNSVSISGQALKKLAKQGAITSMFWNIECYKKIVFTVNPLFCNKQS